MTGRRSVIGFSLLCALIACAFFAQSASAVPAKNTTAFTCVKTPMPGTGDFQDAHCDKPAPLGGNFAHETLAPGIKTKVTVSNESTQNETKEASPAVLKGTVAGAKLEITCKTVSGEATQENEEVEAKKHRVRTIGAPKLTSCTVTKPALGCKVKEPITLEVEAEGVEELGAGKNEMGIEFRPSAGETFAEFTIEGCALAGTFKITGTAIATGTPAPTEKHGGATKRFTSAMTKETLKLAGNPAEFESAITVRMAGGGNPISFTTVT